MSVSPAERLHATLEATRAFYDIDIAASAASPPDAPRARKFIPDLAVASATAGLALARRLPLAPGSTHFADHYVSADLARHCIIKVQEFADERQARWALVHALARLMAPRVARCSERGLDLSGLAFCDWGEPATALWWVQANVFIDIASVGREPIPVAAHARSLGVQLDTHLRLRRVSRPAGV